MVCTIALSLRSRVKELFLGFRVTLLGGGDSGLDSTEGYDMIFGMPAV